jgi:hypothetical protein
VDEREAARGRVDFIKVEDWGSGKPEELENLRVEDQGTTLTGEAPFHQLLGRHLAELERSGLSIARPRHAEPLPPFEQWAFAKEHYIQFLADLHRVHAALEAAVVFCRAAQLEGSRLQAVLGLFGTEGGLDRSSKIVADLVHLKAGAVPDPSQNAVAYARYLENLGKEVQTAESRDEGHISTLRYAKHGCSAVNYGERE